MIARAFIAIIRLYQLLLSPWVGFHCRFEPTCSAYAVEALRRHGAMKGSWLAIRRIGSCHPWGRKGFDPVPDARPLNRCTMHQGE
ncbi:MAG: membrane protein insertion efficiency factor YidD [Alphaproteobacteria bacterium]|nr:membrane protein insertion efficiency factor YidD [Alphaproteobacteria bacterium]